MMPTTSSICKSADNIFEGSLWDSDILSGHAGDEGSGAECAGECFLPSKSARDMRALSLARACKGNNIILDALSSLSDLADPSGNIHFNSLATTDRVRVIDVACLPIVDDVFEMMRFMARTGSSDSIVVRIERGAVHMTHVAFENAFVCISIGETGFLSTSRGVVASCNPTPDLVVDQGIMMHRLALMISDTFKRAGYFVKDLDDDARVLGYEDSAPSDIPTLVIPKTYSMRISWDAPNLARAKKDVRYPAEVMGYAKGLSTEDAIFPKP